MVWDRVLSVVAPFAHELNVRMTDRLAVDQLHREDVHGRRDEVAFVVVAFRAKYDLVVHAEGLWHIRVEKAPRLSGPTRTLKHRIGQAHNACSTSCDELEGVLIFYTTLQRNPLIRTTNPTSTAKSLTSVAGDPEVQVQA
eukprot:CAMPEP_0184753594 /NCGR_PEP_ID=MMETSP0315-20130426/44183_1 /TAXON_ID=101924 /ORGANISM="Rhodosorus marinus, Strain UTEX LB 2760" /LENGTH=139 /DNA_ID=CAMNT_0027232977 /DNA_START=762 /DNA_END=1181 /DNA_ORIENTATION=+